MKTLLCLVLWLAGCTSVSTASVKPGSTLRVREFRYADDKFIVIPVSVAGSVESEFILDTGIGITLIDEGLCVRLACESAGQHTGKRMSGQSITVKLAVVPSLCFAGLCREKVTIGVFSMAELAGEMPGIGGFLSLKFFEAAPFTVDYSTRMVSLDDEGSLRRRSAHGNVVPLKLDLDGNALGVFLSLEVPGGPPLSVEVDTGSDSLILDVAFMSRLAVNSADSSVRTTRGKDETGTEYVRYFATIPGPIHPTGAPSFDQRDLKVMFQKIIYQGLVGHSFLRQFVVTYDLPGRRMILARP